MAFFDLFESTLNVRELMSKAFGVLAAFMSEQMGLDLKEELGDEIYNVLIEIREVFERERAECAATWSNFHTESDILNSQRNELFCPDCASELIVFDNNGKADCRFCNSSFEKEEMIESLAGHVYATDNYLAVSQGGEMGCVECPECTANAFITEEMSCAVCGESQEAECALCCNGIPIDELDGSGYCAYCRHRMDRDD